jgi:hypothetical protein
MPELRFEVGEYAFRVPDFKGNSTDAAALQGYIAVALAKLEEYNFPIAPSIREVTAWMVEKRLTGIESIKSSSLIQHSSRALHMAGLLRQVANQYWPVLLDVDVKVTPHPDFVVRK